MYVCMYINIRFSVMRVLLLFMVRTHWMHIYLQEFGTLAAALAQVG